MVAGSLSFARSEDDRLVSGAAAGFAEEHGVDPIVVRGALVILSFVAGIGLVLYVLANVVAVAPGPLRRERRPVSHVRNVAVGLVTIGVALVVRSTGLWLGDAVMVPLIVMVCGVAVLSVVRLEDRPGRSSLSLADLAVGTRARVRLIAGAVLVSLGLVVVGAGRHVSTSVRIGAFATALTVLGLGVLIGPWIARILQTAGDERRQRIRAQEREAMAAHLHDSVLQTLALIQRTADDPRRTVTLARQQERELREWLYGTPQAGSPTLGGAVSAVAAEVESTYHVRVETVVVGDRPMDDDLGALTAALREACVNAAKHSGVDAMSVYVEVAATQVEAFVRDRGRGFDPTALAADRRGIAQSILARLERVGGTATIDSEPGDGTEVHLVVPVGVPSAAGSTPLTQRPS